MDVVSEIYAACKGRTVHCGVSAHPSPTISVLANEFGLAQDSANYREVDAAAARRLVELVLNQDMAYNSECVPSAHAQELADRFLSQFGTESVRFYTNGSFHEGHGPKLGSPGASWNPVTSATYDTGILVIGRETSGCLWVEDED